MQTERAQRLASTYRHLENQFTYQFIDDYFLDRKIFGTNDPRYNPDVDPNVCQFCEERQQDDIQINRCSCFPTLFGAPKKPAPVQIFHTTDGKNNGVIARCDYERGSGIAEFVGVITDGVEGVDVMAGGSKGRCYQIFQGEMDNFTRFINHSCHPNSQFQKFYWRGTERVIVVSRGIRAGNEITVDYSNHYWKGLDKVCLCGEASCRYPTKIFNASSPQATVPRAS